LPRHPKKKRKTEQGGHETEHDQESDRSTSLQPDMNLGKSKRQQQKEQPGSQQTNRQSLPKCQQESFLNQIVI
jgi:hypothetical protein